MKEKLQYWRCLIKEHAKSLRVTVIVVAVLALTVALCRAFVPSGGKLFYRDFQKGFTLYVEQRDAVTAASVWQVEDEDMKNQIYDQCRKIKKYREFDPVTDVVYGGATSYKRHPALYLLTDSYGYKIKMADWQSYSGPVWDKTRHLMSAYNAPLVRFFRIDLSLVPEGEDALRFVMEYDGPDTVNKEGCRGWFSTLPDAAYDFLLSLLDQIDPSNSTRVIQ